MELADVHGAVVALRNKVGPRASVYFSVDRDASIAIYARGIANQSSASLRVYADKGDTFDALFAKAEAAWDGHVDQHRIELIRSMALAIIEITAAHGRCNRAALRMKFPAEDIALYGADAVKEANEIAANGPFEITGIDGGNGAPAEEEATF